MTERVPIILDVDTGTDDALALAYAIASPGLDLVAVTTVAGNVNVEQATANTLAVLDWLGADTIPVHRGASRPLVLPHRDATEFHGDDGLGGAHLPASTRPLGADRGPAAIVRLANQRPGELILVAVGPLTNLAIALNVEPRLPELLRAVVLMGGAYTVPGNTLPDGSFAESDAARAVAEFNIFADPDAAAQVFAAPFARLTAVGLDVSHQVALTTDDWEAVKSRPDLQPAAALFREIGRHAFSTLGITQFALHDPLAVAVAADPDLVGGEGATVTVDVSGAERGRTRMVGSGQVRVATAVDGARALADFRRIMGVPLSEA